MESAATDETSFVADQNWDLQVQGGELKFYKVDDAKSSFDKMFSLYPNGNAYHQGNVGIGTDTPTGALHVETEGSNSSDQIKLSNKDAVYDDWDGSSYSSGSKVEHDNKTWKANDNCTPADEPGVSLLWDQIPTTAKVWHIGQHDAGSNIEGGLSIGHHDGTTSFSDIVIDIEGNVGIGTASPGTDRLHIKGGQMRIDGDNAASQGSSVIYFGDAVGAPNHRYIGADAAGNIPVSYTHLTLPTNREV